MGLIDVVNETVYLITFLTELDFETLAKITIYNDNHGAEQLARNPVYHRRSKHIDIRYNWELLQNQLIKLEYLPTKMMLADVSLL